MDIGVAVSDFGIDVQPFVSGDGRVDVGAYRLFVDRVEDEAGAMADVGAGAVFGGEEGR